MDPYILVNWGCSKCPIKINFDLTWHLLSFQIFYISGRKEISSLMYIYIYNRRWLKSYNKVPWLTICLEDVFWHPSKLTLRTCPFKHRTFKKYSLSNYISHSPLFKGGSVGMLLNRVSQLYTFTNERVLRNVVTFSNERLICYSFIPSDQSSRAFFALTNQMAKMLNRGIISEDQSD